MVQIVNAFLYFLIAIYVVPTAVLVKDILGSDEYPILKSTPIVAICLLFVRFIYKMKL